MQNPELQSKNISEEQRAISLLNQLIKNFRRMGLANIPSNCNEYGNPALNMLYVEIFKCVNNNQPILALAGAGIFLEDFVNLLWVASQIHEKQLLAKFNNWDEIMEFKKELLKQVEEQKISYQNNIKPDLEKILEKWDLDAIELLRNYIVRHNFIHLKRIYLIELLQKYNLLPKTMPVRRANISKGTIARLEKIEFELTHPLFFTIGFKVVAEQIAPAILIFVYNLFKKYHKKFAPLADKNLGFNEIK